MGRVDFAMDSKGGRTSPMSGCSSNSLRGNHFRSNPFCPGTSSRLSQSIVKDHMVSHYKKIYSAKAAVDVSVPKSLTHSVKYNDQKRREQLKKCVRPQSAHSLLQGNNRTSFSPKHSRGSVHSEDPYFCSGSSVTSSQRINTTFHAKQIVYPSCGSRSQSHPICPSSEFSCRNPGAKLHKQQSAHSSDTVGAQSIYKSFQDPVQKTYSGDLLQKHSHYFTHDKPFTPRTLKSDRSSYLSKYRYYTAPPRKPEQECTNARSAQSETYHESTQLKDYSTTEFAATPQGFITEHEWSEDESLSPNVSKQPCTNKSRGSDYAHSSSSHLMGSRKSPAGIKSPIMGSISSEEEELMYLEFIVDVTNYILSRGLFSDRVLDRVFERHIDSNRHRLNVGKMRRLLEKLRKDLEDPVNTPICSAELEVKEKEPLRRRRRSSREPAVPRTAAFKEDDSDLFPYASLISNRDSPECASPSSIPLQCSTPVRAASPENIHSHDLGEPRLQRGVGPDPPGNNNNEYTGISEDDLDQIRESTVTHRVEYASMAGDEGPPLDPPKDNCDGPYKELEDLGRGFSESLRISSNTLGDNVGDANEPRPTSRVSLSDDDF